MDFKLEDHQIVKKEPNQDNSKEESLKESSDNQIKEIPPELNQPEFIEFLQLKEIKESDYPLIIEIINLIESWSIHDRDIILAGDLHNFFYSAQDSTQQKLESMKNYTSRPDNWQEFLDKLITLTSRYNYMAPHVLLRRYREWKLRAKKNQE